MITAEFIVDGKTYTDLIPARINEGDNITASFLNYISGGEDGEFEDGIFAPRIQNISWRWEADHYIQVIEMKSGKPISVDVL